MIPFFRKIRYRLSKDNKFFQYSRYAIGEIVLVVIGILIALQINNWNERKKLEKRTNLLFEKTQKELKYNIERCNSIIRYYRRKDLLLYNVLNRKVTYDDYKKNGKYKHLIGQYRNANLVTEAFNTMIENNVEYSSKQDSVISNLRGLYGLQKKDVDRDEIETYSLVNSFLTKIRDTKSWYGLDEVTDQEINYYLKDSFYYNNVKHFELIAYKNHLLKLAHFKIRATTIHKEISDYLDSELDSTIVKNGNDYKHYLGVYEIDSLRNVRYVLDNENIIAQVIEKNDSVVLESAGVIIESKEFFIDTYGVFCELIFNENNEVTTLVRSRGSFRKKYKKIE
jgi:hypothetical protein